MIVFLAVLGAITAGFGVVVSANAKFITHQALGALLWCGGLMTVAIGVAGYKIVESLGAVKSLLAASALPSQSLSTVYQTKAAPEPHNSTAPAQSEGEATVVSTRSHLGIYYAILSDGTIRVRVKSGEYTFRSVEDFKEHLSSNRVWWADQAGRQV